MCRKYGKGVCAKGRGEHPLQICVLQWKVTIYPVTALENSTYVYSECISTCKSELLDSPP